MGDFQKADGELAARVGHAFAQTGDAERLARRAARQQIEGAERRRPLNEVGRGDVAEVRMAEAAGQHGAGELLNLRTPKPFGFRQGKFSAADTREAGSRAHQPRSQTGP
nr:hypothetical protein [Sphingobium chungbukense]